MRLRSCTTWYIWPLSDDIKLKHVTRWSYYHLRARHLVMRGSAHNPLVHYSVLTMKWLHLFLFHLVQQHISCESKCKRQQHPDAVWRKWTMNITMRSTLITPVITLLFPAKTAPEILVKWVDMMHAGDRIRLGLGSCLFVCVRLVHATRNALVVLLLPQAHECKRRSF